MDWSLPYLIKRKSKERKQKHKWTTLRIKVRGGDIVIDKQKIFLMRYNLMPKP